MAETQPLTPTDAEIVAFAVENGMHVRTGRGAVKFARAVLAKWGTPPAVAGEPVARLEIGKTKGGVSLTHIAEPAAFQLQEGMYALYTTPQPTQPQAGAVQPAGREPLTHQNIAPVRRFLADRGIYLSDETTKALITVAHGIKGGQHGL